MCVKPQIGLARNGLQERGKEGPLFFLSENELFWLLAGKAETDTMSETQKRDMDERTDVVMSRVRREVLPRRARLQEADQRVVRIWGVCSGRQRREVDRRVARCRPKVRSGDRSILWPIRAPRIGFLAGIRAATSPEH